MNHQTALKIIEKTKIDYNRIATDFTLKRQKISNDVCVLKKYANTGDYILDLGCGSGRLCEIFEGMSVKYLGADNCEEFIKIASSKYSKTPNTNFNLIESGLNTPYPDNTFDKVYCLSVIHHLPGHRNQHKLIQEIHRILKPKGLIIITAWDIANSPKMRKLLFWHNLKKFFGFSKLDYNDLYLPYTNSTSTITFNRYLHNFSLRSLSKIVKKAEFKIIESGYNYRGSKIKNTNIIIVAQK